MIITLKLPWPPSTNAYYRVFKNRAILTKAARQYRETIVGLFGGHQPLTGRLGIVIYVFPPDKRLRDLDNLLKQPLDALQHAGVFLNDGQIDQLMIRRQNVEKPGYLLVTIDDGDTSNEASC
jgi:crossover junction endodeoxyribonuclease RusA